ncbi:hypothetical protein Dimus_030047 [Dionaea muscipula]
MAAATTSSLPWHPLLHNPSRNDFKKLIVRTPPTPLPSSARRMRSAGGGTIRAFRRSDFDSFARRMASGEAWKDAWRSANDGFEQFVFETRKAAERLNRRYSVSLRLSSVARAAADRALEIDREFEVTQRWRTFSLDFRRNWPRVCSPSVLSQYLLILLVLDLLIFWPDICVFSCNCQKLIYM